MERSREQEDAQRGRRPARQRSLWLRDADLDEKVDSHEVQSRASGWRLAVLSFSSLVVFGDIGTSPLYTLTAVFHKLDASDEDLVLGTFSMVFWTLTLVCGLQYVVIMLFMRDNGEGGTFALYALICRAANIRATGQIHETERGLSGFGSDSNLGRRKHRTIAAQMRRVLRSNKAVQQVLLGAALLGACLLMADGVLTPSVSVTSAVEGLTLKVDLSDGSVAGISIAVLVVLFAIQPFGTGWVSFLFAPVLLLWFLSNAAIGIYNIVKYDPSVFRALSPYYVYRYWSGSGHAGWVALASLFLSITGCELLYDDVGQFSAAAIRLSFFALVYPSLVLCYLGQTAMLLQHPDAATDVYWKSIPDAVFWPMLVVGTSAAVVASQALITAAFGIAQQAAAVDLFPRLTVRHTSEQRRGQIYVPQVNWGLMIGCVVIVGIFQTGESLENAYGLAVVLVMLVSTWLATVCMLVAYDVHPLPACAFFLLFTFIEMAYASSNAEKVPKGAWFPLALSVLLFALGSTWHWGQGLKTAHIARHTQKLGQLLLAVAPSDTTDATVGGKMPATPAAAASPSKATKPNHTRAGQGALQLSDGTSVSRIPGVGVYLSELLDGVPPAMARFLAAVPSVHNVVVLLTVRQVPVPRVLPEEALLVRKLALPSFYHAVVRCGYMDEVRFDKGFEGVVLDELAAYLAPDPVVVGGEGSLRPDDTPIDHAARRELLARLSLPLAARTAASGPLAAPGHGGEPSPCVAHSMEAAAADGAEAASTGELPWVQRPSVLRRVHSFAAAGRCRSDGISAVHASLPPPSRPERSSMDGQSMVRTRSSPATAHSVRAVPNEALAKGGEAVPAAEAAAGGDGGKQRGAVLPEPRKRLFRALTLSSSGLMEGGASGEQGGFGAELEQLRAARQRGVYFLIGKSKLAARAERRWVTRFLLEDVYRGMVNNAPATATVYRVPLNRSLELTNTYLV